MHHNPPFLFLSLSHIHTHVVVQLFNCVQLFATPWTAANQAFLSITNSWSLLKLMSIETEMPSNHLDLFSSPSPSAFNPSQNQGRFWAGSLHQVAKAHSQFKKCIHINYMSYWNWYNVFWAPKFSSFFFFFFWGGEGSVSLTKRQSPNRWEVFRIF